MKTLFFLGLLFLSGAGFAQTVGLDNFATGFQSPVEITHAGDSRLFVAEQGGTIKILNDDGTTNANLFLSISQKISSGGERGLLGLAFHSDYATNGYFFVDYTNTDGNTVIARYQRSSENPDVADDASEVILLTITQPFANHNGGCLRFGPDGYLYVSMGDGGDGGDPNNNAQNINSLLGKMLRLDVNTGTPYANPATNRYAGTDGADEIWSLGLRNAWKFSFNRTTGTMWIADVGQNEVEEINKVEPADSGYNFGWRCYEGTQPYNTDGCNTAGSYTAPYAQYTHASGGCSITGGYVYTGENYPVLQDKYLFTDYCSAKIGIVSTEGAITYTESFAGNSFTTFGEDINGELYIADAGSGTIYKITDTTAAIKNFNKAGFALSPNPAGNEVFISTVNPDFNGTASIYNIDGKLVARQDFTAQSNRIDTSVLQSGLYMLEITASGSRSYEKLIVK